MSAPQDAPFVKAPPVAPAMRLGRLVPLGLVVLAVAVAYALGWHRALSLATLVEHRAAIATFISGHGVLAVLSYVGLYAAATAGALPAGAVLAVAGGFLFGPFVGGFGAMLGSTLRCSIGLPVAHSRSRFGAAPARCWRRSRRDFAPTRSTTSCFCGLFRLRPGSPAWVRAHWGCGRQSLWPPRRSGACRAALY